MNVGDGEQEEQSVSESGPETAHGWCSNDKRWGLAEVCALLGQRVAQRSAGLVGLRIQL